MNHLYELLWAGVFILLIILIIMDMRS